MPWGAVAGAVASYGLNKLGNSASTQTNGGAGTQTDTKAPWAAAQPWIQQNMQQGQALQQQYQNQPFSPQQQQAYANSYGQSDYMRQLVPSLLNQMQSQPAGFDLNNPTKTQQTPWNWNAGGLLGSGTGSGGAQGSMTAAQAQADADAAAKKTASGDFKQFDPSTTPAAGYYAAFMSPTTTGMMTDQGAALKSAFTSALGDAGGAGYGDFKYGSAMPAKGTQAYKDMNEYFAYGGNDPYNLYGKAPSTDAQVPVNLSGLLGSK